MLTILQATNDDQLRDLSILAEEIWREHFTPILPDGQVDYMLDKFQSFTAMKRQTTSEAYTYYQLIDDDKLIGYFAVKPDGDRLFLSKLYLHRSCRGKGFARVAMGKIKEICKDSGFDKIWLTVNRYNTHTITVYKHLGFKIFDECATDIGGGFVMDDYFMELEI